MTSTSVAMKPAKKRHVRWKKILSVYLLLLPGMAYLIVNNYLPMFGIVIAFKNLNFRKGIFGSDWCGFDNFKFLFASGNAWTMTRNTILYNVAFIILGIVIPITVAILMNEIRQKLANRVYQTLILLPYLMSWVVVSYLAYAFLSMETGFINNSILAPLGIKSVDFYQDTRWWPLIIIFINQWKSIGFGMVIYLASVIGISHEYFEAAKIDGATKWQQIWFVTLPMLRSTIITLMLLQVGRIFYSDFGLFYQVPMDSGALYDVTKTVDTYVYRSLMVLNNVSIASAGSTYQAIVGFVLVFCVNMVVRRRDKDNALF